MCIYLSTHLPACLPASRHLPTCLPAACLPAHLLAYRQSDLPTYAPTHLRTCPPTYLFVYLICLTCLARLIYLIFVIYPSSVHLCFLYLQLRSRKSNTREDPTSLCSSLRLVRESV